MLGPDAIARGDLRARLGSPRGVLVQTVYLAAWAAFMMLSLPTGPERFGLGSADFLRLALSIQIVAVTYLSSSVASSELGMEGEKGVADLALSAFSPQAVAIGKLLSGALYSAYLVAIGIPLGLLSAGLRDVSAWPIAWAAAIALGTGTAAGVWGAWLGGRIGEDLARSLVHWTLLLVFFWATFALPPPWSVASPLRALEFATSGAWPLGTGASIAGYLVLAGAGTALVAARVRDLRAVEAEG